MNVSFHEPDVRVAGTLELRAAFGVRNESGKAWRAEEGDGIGYHLFDRESGTLIVDGPRMLPAKEIASGQAARVDFAVELPVEDGRYQVFFSPMREGECWYYDRGWPFLLVETKVKDGTACVESTRVTTRRSLRLHNAWRGAGRALTYPISTVWRNWSLIRVMVRRDILGRYRGSFGGGLWAILNPLLLMLTYFFVFGVVLGSRFSSDPSRAGFALYFLAGMLPWLAFSEAAGRAPSIILEHRNFVKKLVFAVETLPVNLVVSGLVSEAFAIGLFLAGLLLVRGSVPASVLWLPALLVPQLLFTAGVAWFLAALGVLFRDLGQINGFLLTIWFFVTPICYEEKALPAQALGLLSKNPMYILVRGYRQIFLEGHAPAFGPTWKLWLMATVVFVLGHAWFYKLRRSFADII